MLAKHFKCWLTTWVSCDSTVSQGSSFLSFPWPLSFLKKFLLDFFFFPIKQNSIAVTMDLADSLSFVDLEELLAVAQHIQHWFL